MSPHGYDWRLPRNWHDDADGGQKNPYSSRGLDFGGEHGSGGIVKFFVDAQAEDVREINRLRRKCRGLMIGFIVAIVGGWLSWAACYFGH